MGRAVVVFTGKDLSADEERRLRSVAKSIVLKDVQSPERLLDETALFLHRVVADLRSRNGICWSVSTGRRRRCEVVRFSSSTTTLGTSSRRRRSSRIKRWRY